MDLVGLSGHHEFRKGCSALRQVRIVRQAAGLYEFPEGWSGSSSWGPALVRERTSSSMLANC